MLIAESNLNLSGSHYFQSQDIQKIETVNPSRNAPPEENDTAGSAASVRLAVEENLAEIRNRVYNRKGELGSGTGSRRGGSLMRPALAELMAQNAKSVGADGEEAESLEDVRSIIVRKMIEYLTGRKVELKPVAESLNGSASASPQENAPGGPPAETRIERTHAESETTSFSADGVIRTADGREIEISVAVNMSRSFVERQRITIENGRPLTDPLVINFDGSAAQLTETQFAFDLNSDGQMDRISFPGGDSGFVALDKNGDGAINDGGELFGVASGDGFADLAAYDEDGNQWIDEGDSIFSRLQVWKRGDEGESSLTALKDRGVGAIYLGRQETPFDIRDGANGLLGRVRASGIFLNEDGTAGTLQQLDLVA